MSTLVDVVDDKVIISDRGSDVAWEGADYDYNDYNDCNKETSKKWCVRIREKLWSKSKATLEGH